MQIMGVNLKDTGLETFTVRFLNRDLPLMMTSYESALESYFLLPFLLIFGVNIYAYRFCWLFYAVIALFLYYLFAKEVFDDKRATLFAFLLAINPTFIFAARLGTYSCIPLLMVVPAALLSLARWLKGKGSIYFACGLFLLGLGLSLRAAFIWLLGGIFFAALVFFASVKKRIDSEKMRFKYLFYPGIGMISFLLGYWTVVYYNLIMGFHSITYVLNNFLKPSEGASNLTYLYCLRHRIFELRYLMEGRWFLLEMGSWDRRPSTSTVTNPIYWILILMSLIWLVYFLVRIKHNKIERKKRFFILTMVLGAVALSPFPCAYYVLSGPRVFSIYPFLILLVALMFMDVFLYFKKKFIIIPLLILLISLSLFELRTFVNSHIFLKDTGGTGNFSDAIYELNDWLLENRYLRPRLIGWGFNHGLFFLSQGKIIAREIFSMRQCPGEKEKVKDKVIFSFIGKEIQEDTVYISRTENFENLKGVTVEFKDFLKQRDKLLVELRRFYQRDKEPIYAVYAIR